MKLKKWELALIAALVLTFVFTPLVARVQPSLAENVIRLHVVANSDNALDQTVKLLVRNRVLETAEPLLGQTESAEEAIKTLEKHLPALTDAANEISRKYGYDAAVTLDREYFSTRHYETFSLPAGTYTALRIRLGQAEGQNWWCVIFPELCTAPALDEAADGVLTQEQMRLITQEDGYHRVKFKIVELWEEFRHWISGK